MEKENKTESKVPDKVPDIYRAMVAVARDLAKVGVAKDRRNEQQNFVFRGIDGVMNTASPILAEHGVLLQIQYTDLPDVERVTAKGATLIHSRVLGHFTFISMVDGSWVTMTFPGTGMDSGDKALNKAMSASLKYALLQTFLIPTESMEDADATTPEPSAPKPPDGFSEWFPAIVAEGDNGFDALRSAWADSPEVFRKYTMAYRADEWAAAKKHATEVTTARKKAAPAAAEATEKPAKATK